MTASPEEFPFIAADGRVWAWNDVHTHIQRLLREQYPRVSSDIMQDAVQEAVLDLLAYWQGLASSQDRGHLNFEFALRRAMHAATQHISSEVQRYSVEVPYAFGNGPGAEEADDDSGAFIDFEDPDLTPEEQVIEASEQERVRQYLGTLTPDELADAFLVMDDRTQWDIANELGVNQSTVQRRLNRATTRVKDTARRYAGVL